MQLFATHQRTSMKLLTVITIIGTLTLSACAIDPKKQSIPDPDGPPPKLLSPLVKKIWIPPVIKNGGTEWEQGHYLYRIEREPTWSR